MAKAKESTGDVQGVALALFLSTYRPQNGISAWKVSVDCFRAAAEFIQVAEEIATGASPCDVIASRQLQDEHDNATQNTGAKEQQNG